MIGSDPGPEERPAVVVEVLAVGDDWIGAARTEDEAAELVRFVTLSGGPPLVLGQRGWVRWVVRRSRLRPVGPGFWCFRPEVSETVGSSALELVAGVINGQSPRQSEPEPAPSIGVINGQSPRQSEPICG